MSRNREVTNKKEASIAANVLRDPKASKAARSAAGSALTRRSNKKNRWMQGRHAQQLSSLVRSAAPRPAHTSAGLARVSSMPRKMTGSDGRSVTIPDGGRGVQGRDGHMVAIPKGHRSVEGRDGRVVAVPPGARGVQGRDGRIAPIRPGKRAVEDERGRMRNK